MVFKCFKLRIQVALEKGKPKIKNFLTQKILLQQCFIAQRQNLNLSSISYLKFF